MHKIPLSFYQQEDVVQLSRTLLGKYLLTCFEGQLTGGMITETEAYYGAEDKACHAYNNRRTERTKTMYLEGGVSYVYLCYGLHHLFNIVTNKEETPHAILIRAIKPEIGIETMLKRRKKQNLDNKLTNGPGALSQALGINKQHNGLSLDGPWIWLENRGVCISEENILSSPRIGVEYAQEDALKPWRFYTDGV